MTTEMKIRNIYARCPEKKGFTLKKQRVEDFYVFIHFMTRVKLHDGSVVKEGGCILSAPYSYRYFKAEECALMHDRINIIGDLTPLTV